MRKLSVVAPIYNERENILRLYDEILSILKELVKNKIINNYEIVFVDDGSRDGSSQILKDLAKKDKKLKIITFRKNFGQTPALKAGFDFCTGDIIVTMDSDLQNDPKDIPRLIKKLDEGYDVVSGWRFNRKDSFFKRIVSRMINNLRMRLIGDYLHDYGCSLKIYKKEAIKDLELFGELHRYITAYLFIKGYRIGEVKTHHRPRIAGKTKYSIAFGRGINGIMDLFYLKFWLNYSNRPLHFFGRLGLIQWGIAGLIIIEQIIKAYLINSLDLGPLLMLSAVLGISGLLFVMFGFLFEIVSRTYFSENKIYSIGSVFN